MLATKLLTATPIAEVSGERLSREGNRGTDRYEASFRIAGSDRLIKGTLN